MSKDQQYNPYKVLNLPRNYTLEQLRSNYKKLALQLHPDKIGAKISQETSAQVFAILTDSYRRLMKKLQDKESDKQFDALKKDSDHYRTSNRQELTPQELRALNTQFDVKRFNAVFEENDIDDDPYKKQGYTKWEDEAPESKASSSALVKMQPLGCSTSLDFYELGIDHIDDFSGKTFSDYKRAYSTMSKLMSTEEESDAQKSLIKNAASSVDDLKSRRSNVQYTMNPSEQEAYLAEVESEKAWEEMRQQRVKQRDTKLINHYEAARSRLPWFGTAAGR